MLFFLSQGPPRHFLHKKHYHYKFGCADHWTNHSSVATQQQSSCVVFNSQCDLKVGILLGQFLKQPCEPCKWMAALILQRNSVPKVYIAVLLNCVVKHFKDYSGCSIYHFISLSYGGSRDCCEALLVFTSILSDGISPLSLVNWSAVASWFMILCLISTAVLCNGEVGNTVIASGVGCTSNCSSRSS